MNPDGQVLFNLTNHPADDVQPVFSPTGEHILFCSDRDRSPFSFDLYLMDANGSNVRGVFAKSRERVTPAWSPDGRQIIYVRSELGVPYLYIAPIDGKREDRVVIGIMPVWSPDGKEIAFLNSTLKHPRYITLLNVQTLHSKFFFSARCPSMGALSGMVARWQQARIYLGTG
jgi:Tol biopolymer transport system component